MVRAAFRNTVGIGQVDHFSAHRGIAGHGVFAQRENEFRKWKLHAVILSEFKEKVALAWTGRKSIGACLLHEIK